MKILKLSIILATNLLIGYTYAAPVADNELYGINTIESNYMEDYSFGIETPVVKDRVNFSVPITTKSEATDSTISHDIEEYAFDTETSTVSERINFSVSPATENSELLDSFLGDESFNFN